jgi:hypothetical protein
VTTSKLKPDIAVDAYFFTASEGGKRQPIPLTGSAPFGCVLQVDGKGFDCRITENEGVLEAGQSYQLHLKFLFWEDAKKYLPVAKQFEFWSGSVIARGTVVEILSC